MFRSDVRVDRLVDRFVFSQQGAFEIGSTFFGHLDCFTCGEQRFYLRSKNNERMIFALRFMGHGIRSEKDCYDNLYDVHRLGNNQIRIIHAATKDELKTAPLAKKPFHRLTDECGEVYILYHSEEPPFEWPLRDRQITNHPKQGVTPLNPHPQASESLDKANPSAAAQSELEAVIKPDATAVEIKGEPITPPQESDSPPCEPITPLQESDTPVKSGVFKKTLACVALAVGLIFAVFAKVLFFIPKKYNPIHLLATELKGFGDNHIGRQLPRSSPAS